MSKPPIEHPLYLLDINQWQVRLFKACWDDPESGLSENGYGAISYAWGKWKDQEQTAAALPNYPKGYPTFDIGEDPSNPGHRMGWVFPLVRPYMSNSNRQDPSKEQFMIQDARRTLEAAGKRFVWWDWACIPQNIKKGHPLDGIAQAEMNKMRVVYPYSTQIIIWAHTIDWQKTSPLRLAVEACREYRASWDWLGTDVTVAAVEKVTDALSNAYLAEEWFRSLWCFQEGVLCMHPYRRAGGSSGSFIDMHGLSIDGDKNKEDSDILELSSTASGIMFNLVNMLQASVEAPPPSDQEQLQGAPETWKLKEWCSNPAFEQPARGLVNRLMATGLPFMGAQNPLGILNARLGRQPSARSNQMEIEVNTVIGALEVDVTTYQDAASATAAREKAAIPKDWTQAQKDARVAEIDADEVSAVREGMLAELFRYYQWRMLFLATARRISKRKPVSGNLTGLWSELVKVPRYRSASATPFTALEAFLSVWHLPARFSGPKLRYEGDPPPDEVSGRQVDTTNQFNLPELKYLPDQKLLVLKQMLVPARPADGKPPKQSPPVLYKLFKLDGYEKPLWTKCMFYDQARGGSTSFVPTFEFVAWEDRNAVFGDKLVLVPVEYLYKDQDPRQWEKEKTRLRCVVLSNFGEANYPKLADEELNTLPRAVFVGLVDIEGDDAEKGISLEEGNLECDTSVIIY
ncbi:HET domain-containing protein [Microdochium nivale]|nr:HET domain-containing protein [Microdochium nivale]